MRPILAALSIIADNCYTLQNATGSKTLVAQAPSSYRQINLPDFHPSSQIIVGILRRKSAGNTQFYRSFNCRFNTWRTRTLRKVHNLRYTEAYPGILGKEPCIGSAATVFLGPPVCLAPDSLFFHDCYHPAFYRRFCHCHHALWFFRFSLLTSSAYPMSPCPHHPRGGL